MRDHHQAFDKAGAGLAAIGLGDRRYAQAFREETGIRFPLLVDERREAYRAASLRNGSLLSLLRKETFVARRRAIAAGVRQHRPGKNPFQLGAAFVFGPEDVDRNCHLSRAFGDNAAPEALMDALGSRGP